MNDKDQKNYTSGAARDAYHDTRAPSPDTRAAVERKLRLRFTPKKEAGE